MNRSLHTFMRQCILMLACMGQVTVQEFVTNTLLYPMLLMIDHHIAHKYVAYAAGHFIGHLCYIAYMNGWEAAWSRIEAIMRNYVLLFFMIVDSPLLLTTLICAMISIVAYFSQIMMNWRRQS